LFRFITRLTGEERSWANSIAEGFGQRVCGFDLLRSENGSKSQVIDVNGWSFVKGNDNYYGAACAFAPRHSPFDPAFPIDRTAEILAALCMRVSSTIERPLPTRAATQEAPTWVLKANVTVFRHADRTPKVSGPCPASQHSPQLIFFLAKTQVQLPYRRSLDSAVCRTSERRDGGDHPAREGAIGMDWYSD
jgi:hypothetical protein